MDGKIKIEPKIGEIITVDGVKYITQKASDGDCPKCALWKSYCWNIVCNVASRKDCTSVIFKKLETDMNEVKIQIPETCVLIKDGDTYVVREKKQIPPRSWEEFCEKFPIKPEECLIDTDSDVLEGYDYVGKRKEIDDRCFCINKKEAEAFLALMQLRQLRKAWVGDWEPSRHIEYSAILVTKRTNRVEVGYGYWEYSYPMTFPTEEMAEDFFGCFRDLCETAKILL